MDSGIEAKAKGADMWAGAVERRKAKELAKQRALESAQPQEPSSQPTEALSAEPRAIAGTAALPTAEKPKKAKKTKQAKQPKPVAQAPAAEPSAPALCELLLDAEQAQVSAATAAVPVAVPVTEPVAESAPIEPPPTAELESAEVPEASSDATVEAVDDTLAVAEAGADDSDDSDDSDDDEVEEIDSLDEDETTLELSANDQAFARIPAPLQGALVEKGYQQLTAVQLAVLDSDSLGRDLQVSSQTGSGKTVAIGILMAEKLIASLDETSSVRPQALVITPTRELAQQVQKELDWLFAKLRGLSVTVVTGGTSVAMERRELRCRPMVVVGTPGRLLDHIKSGSLSCAGVAQVVLDEADQMLDMGFREELEGILDSTPDERATHLVSATFPLGIQKLTHRYQKNPLHVEGTRLGKANEDIEHIAHLIHEQDRYAALVNLLLLAENERVLIFVNTRADTSGIAEALSRDGFPAMPLSGELQQAQRTRTLAAFRAGTAKVLVATDVAARGLDIADVNIVIQAATPIDSEIYIHRGGRTGRAGQKGRCVLLIPQRRERQLRRLLNEAGVQSNWCDVPTQQQVQKSLEKRASQRILDAIDDQAALVESDLEHARRLLAEREPERIIATLLRLTKPEGRSSAKEIGAAESNTRGWKHRERERGEQGQGGRFRSGAQSGFERFSVNWGFRGGATPQRLLAMICRRGGIKGQMVGAIEVNATETLFDVSTLVAGEFETHSRRIDPREPSLQIRRFEGNNSFQGGGRESYRGSSGGQSRPYGSGGYRGGARGGARGGSRGGGSYRGREQSGAREGGYGDSRSSWAGRGDVYRPGGRP